MTLEELADCGADVLEKLTLEQLDEICKPFYNVTRPELAPKPQKSVLTGKSSASVLSTLTPQKQKALQLLAAEGVDISFLQRKKK